MPLVDLTPDDLRDIARGFRCLANQCRADAAKHENPSIVAQFMEMAGYYEGRAGYFEACATSVRRGPPKTPV